MKTRLAVLLILGLALVFVFQAVRPHRLATDDRTEFDLRAFGRLPVLEGGRLKPIDTVARNSLVLFRGKQRALDAEDRPIPPLQWMADVLFDRETASRHRIFRVDDPDLLGLITSSQVNVAHFSYAELLPHLAEIDRQARLAPEENALRSRYQKAVIRLRAALIHYQNLETALVPHLGRGEQLSEAYARYLEILPQVAGMMRAMQAGQNPADDGTAAEFIRLGTLLRQASESSLFFAIPQPTESPLKWADAQWSTPGTAILSMVHGGPEDLAAFTYGHMADAWRDRDPEVFARSIRVIQEVVGARISNAEFRTGLEFAFNQSAPFMLSMQLYALAFLAVAFSWLFGVAGLSRAAFMVVCLAILPHTFGLVVRVYLSGYAPVTNLYSSAVFVGWAAVLFSIPLERVHGRGLAVGAAALTGLVTLIVAHNLAMAGGNDTMEMMRAVLDSNFWLSTHVITIVIGYSATFLAAALGLFFILGGVCSPALDKETAKACERMVYGTTCFALLFSFVGTVLGGIWADQSWGRFWGWDPKENGALMIVLWTALMLHAKRIRMVDRVGFMRLAVGGGIVTSWSWFGTNLLGVGLHSYGFMERGFFWLTLFWASQGALILLSTLPRHRWRSPSAGTP